MSEIHNLKPIKHKDPLYLFLKWALVLGLAMTAFFLISKPVRQSLSDKYVERGDNYLLQKKYLQAELEFTKAVFIKKSDFAKSRIELSTDASREILSLAPFFREKRVDSQIDLFEEALDIENNATEAVKKSKSMIENGEYQLAVIPAERATTMEKAYRDGWVYLGIANLKCAQFLQVSEEDKYYYRTEAEKALLKAKDIDPSFQPTEDFLKELKGI